jgi:hypothetical protein
VRCCAPDLSELDRIGLSTDARDTWLVKGECLPRRWRAICKRDRPCGIVTHRGNFMSNSPYYSVFSQSIHVRGVSSLLATAALVIGCGRSESGALQKTVPSGSPPPTPAFATNALQTSSVPSGAAVNSANGATQGSPANALGGAADEAPVAQAATDERACSVAGNIKVEKVADHHFRIGRAELSALAQSLRSNAAEPAQRQLTTARTDNGLSGIRVEGVGPQAECGLEPNDIVVSINGVPTTNRAVLAQKREELLQATRLDVTVERGRKPVTLRYDVRH